METTTQTPYVEMATMDEMVAATTKAYDGVAARCACGCAGNYYEASGSVWDYRADRGRGVSFHDPERAALNIRRIAGKVFRNHRRGDDVDLSTHDYGDGTQMVAVVMSGRLYILSSKGTVA